MWTHVACAAPAEGFSQSVDLLRIGILKMSYKMSMIVSCYPSPACSPVANASDLVVPLKRLPLHLPVVTKRRKISPVYLKPSSASFKLDVYSYYSSVPDTLLYSRSLDDRSSDDGGSSIVSSKSSSSVDHELANVEIVAPTPVIKAASTPASIDQNVDFSVYRNTSSAPIVEKKGTPLNIPPDSPCYNDLTVEELRTCSTLRMLPEQYMHVKKTMISAVINKPFFNKRDAQVWFRMDVNKTCLLYGWFKAIGWIPDKENWHLGPKC